MRTTRSNGARSAHHPLFEIRKSRIQGRGAFATRRIRPGQRIVQYTGPKITNEEADRIYDEEKMGRHHTFLFILDDEHCIDGKVASNKARLINHSCDPNCEVVVDKGEIWIYAKQNIQPGKELSYDYAYEWEDDPKMAEFYICHCGAPKCRGTIMEPPKRRRKKKKAQSRAGKRKR